ncbi:MAG: Maf family protein [Bacteriovoracales bacterium]|nr:Maf family protein [Bacteriovoracales bacterium]
MGQKTLILASSSPFRRELLSRLAVSFQTVSPTVEEQTYKDSISDPKTLSKVLALEKAKNVLSSHPDAVAIGADQLVFSCGQIFGKPLGRAKAKEQLAQLSGKTHELITGVALYDGSRLREWTQIDHLTMKSLSEEKIERYLNLDAPFQCAGSYRIEKSGIALFDKIETDDYTGIIGLPLVELSKGLAAFGFEVLEA